MRLSGARTAPRSTARWLLASLLVGLAALSLLPHAHALFEDQAGAFDWHKALIGIPQRSMLVQPPASPRRPHLITVTAKNVLASLDPVKGALRWRHAFPKHSEHLDPVHGWDVHVAPVKAGRSYVATVTTPMPLRHDLAVTDIDLDASFDNDGARTLLRVWDLDTGFIVLEQEIASAATSTAYGPPVVRFAPSPPPGGNDAADDEGDDVDVDAQGRKRPGPLVIVALPGVEAVAYRVVTGAKLWSTPLPATPGGVAAILTDADASLKRPGGTVHLATADAHAPARVTLQTLAVAQGTPTRDAMTFSVPATASAAAPVTLKLHAHRGHVYVALMDATRALLLGETLKTPAVLSRLGDDNDDDVGAIAMSAAPSATEALMQTLDADRLVFLNDDPNTLIVALERVAADVANGAPPAATAMPAVAWTLWKLDGASFVPVPEHHGIRSRRRALEDVHHVRDPPERAASRRADPPARCECGAPRPCGRAHAHADLRRRLRRDRHADRRPRLAAPRVPGARRRDRRP
ncbi:hypothetical protein CAUPRSCDRAFT_10847 [Caulochytrium protostelioides]|uniref:EMC1 first beta-propeller domain-containing protein n=1 Tax=Caulochytrium protostelioides TaxID=1555241 RepID=A0A4V1ITL6_9FUNG|nr:hypothetical protein CAUPRSCDRAFT_10847 [Caulochytrium protostelioides]